MNITTPTTDNAIARQLFNLMRLGTEAPPEKQEVIKAEFRRLTRPTPATGQVHIRTTAISPKRAQQPCGKGSWIANTAPREDE